MGICSSVWEGGKGGWAGLDLQRLLKYRVGFIMIGSRGESALLGGGPRAKLAWVF